MSFDYKKLTAAHIRAARGLLGWYQEDLVRESEVSSKTIFNIENEKSGTQPRTLKAIFEAFDKAGVEFTNGDETGVKLKKSDQGE